MNILIKHGANVNQALKVLVYTTCVYRENTVEPPNNGHGGDEHFVHCSEVVPLSEVLPLSTIIIIISLLNHMNNDITDQG